MKLFFNSGTCSQAPHIIMNELDLRFELEKVDFANRDNLLAVNPKGQVPTLLLDDGQVLTETAVILQYLADQRHEYGLLPKHGTIARYKALEWLNFVATDLHKTLGSLFNREMPEEGKAAIRKTADRKLDYLNKHLATSPYLAGGEYTIADAYCFVVLGWTKILAIDMSKFPNLINYCERVAVRPAVAKTLQAEAHQ